MARYRSIKDSHWNDRELVNISLGANLMWIGMWNFSDDAGIIEADPNYIKTCVFPRRHNIRVKQINEWLDQLTKARFIVPLKYDNVSYYLHRTFNIHQRIDKPQPSKIPQQVIDTTLTGFYSENVPGAIMHRIEEKIKEKNGESNGPPANFFKKNIKREIQDDGPAPPKYPEVLECFRSSMKSKWPEEKVRLEAQKFFNHYDAMGWKVNGYPIMKWDSKALEWMIKEIQGVRV